MYVFIDLDIVPYALSLDILFCQIKKKSKTHFSFTLQNVMSTNFHSHTLSQKTAECAASDAHSTLKSPVENAYMHTSTHSDSRAPPTCRLISPDSRTEGQTARSRQKKMFSLLFYFLTYASSLLLNCVIKESLMNKQFKFL